MKRAIVLLAVLAAAVCIRVPLHAAPIWDTTCEGGVIPLPWYFSEFVVDPNDPNEWLNEYDTQLDPVTRNRVAILIDGDTSKNGRLQRDQRRDGPRGMTFYCKFKVESAADDSVRLQVSEDLTGSDATGYTRWSWYNANGGEMRLRRGALTSGSNKFAAPLNQWVEVWVVITHPSPMWKVYVKSGGSWPADSNPTAAGTLEAGGGVCCLGSGSTGVVHVDFLRHHWHGGYGPNDPNAPVMPTETNRIGEAKLNYRVGCPVDFPNKIVTDSWTWTSDPVYNWPIYNSFIIAEDDRTSAVRVTRAASDFGDKQAVGSRASIKGQFENLAGDCELYVVPDPDGLNEVSPAPVPVVLPDPIAMTTARVAGGVAFGAQPGVWVDTGTNMHHWMAHQCLNTVGQRVRICGNVTWGWGQLSPPRSDPASGLNVYYVDDAGLVYSDSYHQSGGTSYKGIKVYTPYSLPIGSWVSITGTAGIERNPDTSSLVKSYQVIYAVQPGSVATY